MTDIELVIKIPEHCLEELKRVELNESNEGVVFHAIKCILNGTPLPKGHGRLIDADAVLEEPIGNTHKDIDIAETIIEADKEG